MFRLQKLNKVCRKYELNFWGNISKDSKAYGHLLALYRDKSKKVSTNSFLQMDTAASLSKKQRLSSFGEILSFRKKVCQFYGGLSKKKFRAMNRLAFKMQGNYALNMLTLLELKLSTVVFRMNFATSILESLSMIHSGMILVNKAVVTYPHYVVSLGDIIEVVDHEKGYRNSRYLKSLNFGVAQPQLVYHEINYNIMAGIVISKPHFNEVPFYFNIDLDNFFSEYFGRY